MSTKQQLADIFTKPLDEQRFCDLRSELNILDSRNLAWPVAHLWLMPRLGKTILFEWVLWKSWILIFGSNLDSCDYCYVLLFVPSHTWIQMFYMSTSNFHPILRSKLISKNNSFWAVFQLIGTSDPWSELPTRVGSLWLLPTGSSRSTKNNSPELPMVCWMFQPCPSEVPSLLR